MLSTGALIAAGLASAAGAVGSAVNKSKAKKEEARNYQNAKDYLNSMYYRDPLSTVGNRSILKAAQRNYADNLEALNNRMVAGGATMENALAARQANNESLDKFYGQLLQGEDARRDRISNQKLQLEDKHSNYLQNSYLQSAQDWSQWGGQMANAALSLGSTGLLGGAGSAAAETAGAVTRADMPVLAQVQNPINLPGAEMMPDQSWLGRGDTNNLGGLKGAHYENGILVRDK